MRVVFVDHTTVPGGAQLALARLLTAGTGDDANWDATLVVPRGPLGAYASLSRSGRVGVVRAGPALRPGAGSAGTRSQLRNALDVLRQVGALVVRREVRRAEVLYANSARSAVYTTIVAAVLRKPVVVHLRDTVSREALGTAGYAVTIRMVLPRAAAVVANSRYTLDVAVAQARLPPLQAIVHSPVGDIYEPAPPAPRPHVRRVGMLARLAPWKGQHLLIEAFARAFPDDEVTLELAGAPLFGEERHAADLGRLAAELGVAERVHFLGHVTDVRSFLDGLDIAVQCSLRPEPLGQNVLQYLARGRPTIAAGEGGPAELIEDGVTGVLVPPRDVKALCDAMRLLAADANFRSLLATGARRSAQTAGEGGLSAISDIIEALRSQENEGGSFQSI